MTYHVTGPRSVARACWRDGRGALRCRRPGAFSGFGADTAALATAGAGSSATKKQSVSPEVFLIAQLNRFQADKAPPGQALFTAGQGRQSFPSDEGITGDVAFAALTVTIRRLQSSLEVLNDEGARTLLAQSRALVTAGDNTGDGDDAGGGAVIQFVKSNALAMGNTIAAYADSLGLPPASLPISFAGLSGKTLIIAGGLAAIGLYLVLNKRRP